MPGRVTAPGFLLHGILLRRLSGRTAPTVAFSQRGFVSPKWPMGPWRGIHRAAANSRRRARCRLGAGEGPVRGRQGRLQDRIPAGAVGAISWRRSDRRTLERPLL
jgi:hypothetical protein